jgi:transposase
VWPISLQKSTSTSVSSMVTGPTPWPKKGRRLFNAAVYALRMRVERTFTWEDKFKRLLLRLERIQQRHYGMKLMAYTLINLQAFCGV